MDYKSNIVLLLLQIVLYRQQELVHNDKSLDQEQLMKDPIIDEEVLEQFRAHTLVKLYAPELRSAQLRKLRNMVKDIFDLGLPDGQPATLVTLANHYYAQRVQELQNTEIPQLQTQVSAYLKENA